MDLDGLILPPDIASQIIADMRALGLFGAAPARRKVKPLSPVEAERERCLGILQDYWDTATAEGADNVAEIIAGIAKEMRQG